MPTRSPVKLSLMYKLTVAHIKEILKHVFGKCNFLESTSINIVTIVTEYFILSAKIFVQNKINRIYTVFARQIADCYYPH